MSALAEAWEPAPVDDERRIQKRGTLYKLPRSTSMLSRSTWQAREFALDSSDGTLRYYGAGDKLKGEVDLRGAAARALPGSLSGRPHCFLIEAAAGGGGPALTLSAASAAEAESWVIALRATAKKVGLRDHWKGGARPEARPWPEARRDENVTADDVDRVQDQTLAAVDRMRRQLQGTSEVARATNDTLRQQEEQMGDVSRDLDRMNHELKVANKNMNRLESWRIFGGGSKKAGSKAKARKKQELKREEERRGPAREFSEDAPSLSERPASRRPSRRNIAAGREGRTPEEAEALKRMAAKDDAVNSGLDDVDDLLDALSREARAMNAQTRRQNEKLGTIQGQLGDAEARTARVNERARHNVGYYGGGYSAK